MKKSLKLVSLIAAMVGSGSVSAATSIWANSTLFDVVSGSSNHDLLQIRPRSWASESMGYLGWTHHSKWGFMDLKKGQAVTITLDSTAGGHKGLHPAITVWHRKTKLKAATVFTQADPKNALTQMNAHSYKQSESILVKNEKNSDDANNPYSIGNIDMEFVANALDADGLGDVFYGKDAAFSSTPVDGYIKYGPYLPLGYMTKNILNSAWTYDSPSVPGKVVLSFIAPKTGVYQFVVGAIKPDNGSDAFTNTNKYTINVDVKVQ